MPLSSWAIIQIGTSKMIFIKSNVNTCIVSISSVSKYSNPAMLSFESASLSE